MEKQIGRKHKKVVKDSIRGVTKNYIIKQIPVRFYNSRKELTKESLHEFLEKRVMGATKEIIMNDIRNNNTRVTDIYISENNIPKDVFTKAVAKRVLMETIQYDIVGAVINKKLLENYCRIFKYIVDACIKEFFDKHRKTFIEYIKNKTILVKETKKKILVEADKDDSVGKSPE